MISRENYEIWFIDFLDGKLSSAQKGELYDFLSQNADLQSEFHDMSVSVPMVAESFSMPKQALKKEITPVGNISETTYENVFIASREGDLSLNEKLGLDEFLATNPFLVSELEYFERLTVSHNGEIFEAKSKLKHSSVIIPMFRYAAAASIIVLLGVGIVRLNWGLSSPAAQMALTYTMDLPTENSFVLADKPANTVIVKEAKEMVKEAPLSKLKSNLQTSAIASQAVVPLPSQGFHAHISESGFNGFPEPSNVENDALSFSQVVGKVIEGSFGETGFSDGLKKQEKLTAADIVDFASIPFKNDKQPVLSTTQSDGDAKRRVKLNLGIFEADFSLR